MYSLRMAMECSRFKCFRRLYAVSIPLIMMKGSVYRLAALAITVHGLPSFYSGTDSRGSYYYSPNYINYYNERFKLIIFRR